MKLRDFLKALRQTRWVFEPGTFEVRTEATCKCPIEYLSHQVCGQLFPELEAGCNSLGIPYAEAIIAATDAVTPQKCPVIHSWKNILELRKLILQATGFDIT